MICDTCKSEVTRVSFTYDNLEKSKCEHCKYTELSSNHKSAYVIQDSIEGGLEVKHGICNPDGSPRMYYSKSDIKRAAFEQGWTISGETPKVNPRLQEQRAIRDALKRT